MESKQYLHQKCGSPVIQRVGGFSASAPDGNEEVCCLYLCMRCRQYYLDCCHTKLTIGDSFDYQREVDAEEAETVKAALAGCQELNNRYCGCEYHVNLGRMLFGTLAIKPGG